MANITAAQVASIVERAVANGGTVYVPSPEHQLESNNGYGGVHGNPETVAALVTELHASAEYWLDSSEDERTEEERVGRLQNWIAHEAREWAMNRA